MRSDKVIILANILLSITVLMQATALYFSITNMKAELEEKTQETIQALLNQQTEDISNLEFIIYE